MIDLKATYKNKIFDRKKSFANSRYVPIVGGIVMDIVIAFAIVKIFNVNWEYAYIKVYIILCFYSFLKYIYLLSVDLLNHKLFIKNALTSEIRHYLDVFDTNVNWNEVATYDDYLLDAAFNKALSDDLRVLAAINYGTVIDTMAMNPQFENRCYKLFCEVAPEFIKNKR